MMGSCLQRIAFPISIFAMVAFVLPWRGVASFSGCRRSRILKTRVPWTLRSSSSAATTSTDTPDISASDEESTKKIRTLPPWNDPALKEIVSAKKRSNARFRQHVNPLARQYQQATVLPDDWPLSVFADASKPLHLDIGCGKGGFLIDICKADDSYNYLGLEIRPGVAAYAKERIVTHQLQGRLDFLGCNANVDLDRLLTLYHHASQQQERTQKQLSDDFSMLYLKRVTIQFPDPHFKSQHAKRRVVTDNLIETLAKYMPTSATVFLQSDVQCKK